MNFREALEREIAAQGLSVTDIARISGVSKGAIYNILNGTTEDDRIRPATRRAIAKGCGRAVRAESDGEVTFVNPERPPVAQDPDGVNLALVPNRLFLEEAHVREGFDWAFARESEGMLPGLGAVDRVFQKRAEFLSVVVENSLADTLVTLAFDLQVAYATGPSVRLPVRLHPSAPPGGAWEGSLYLCTGPAFRLAIENASYATAGGVTGRPPCPAVYVHAEGGGA